jgi:O-antigen ligase
MPAPDTIRLLTIIGFIAFFLVGLKRPVFLVGAYMILVYCKLSSYYPVFGAIKSEMVFAIVIILRLAITPNFFSHLSLSYNRTNKMLFYFVCCVILSFVIAIDHQYSWDIKVYHFIKVLILFIMIITAVDSVDDLKIFTIIFLSMMAYLAYEPFYYFVSGIGGTTHHYGTNYIAQIGILSGHVALANNMNQMIPIAFFLFFSSKSKNQKIIYAAFTTIFIAAMIGSGSRGGVIGFLFFLLTVFIYFHKKNKKLAYAIIVISAVFVVSSAAFVKTISRVDTDSAQGRFIGLTHGIGMLIKGNILGVGPGCYIIARSRYFSYYMESHNLYGQALGDLGIPGTIVWLLFVRTIFLNLIPSLKRDNHDDSKSNFIKYLSLGLVASLAVRLFISMASHGLYFFYWYVVAALSIKIREYRE